MDWEIRERRIRGDLNCVQRSKDFTPIYTRRWWILLGGLFIRSVAPLLLIAQLAERGIVVMIISLPYQSSQTSPSRWFDSGSEEFFPFGTLTPLV
jgi:hypothetical protein